MKGLRKYLLHQDYGKHLNNARLTCEDHLGEAGDVIGSAREDLEDGGFDGKGEGLVLMCLTL